jgi:hypothetical protein
LGFLTTSPEHSSSRKSIDCLRIRADRSTTWPPDGVLAKDTQQEYLLRSGIAEPPRTTSARARSTRHQVGPLPWCRSLNQRVDDSEPCDLNLLPFCSHDTPKQAEMGARMTHQQTTWNWLPQHAFPARSEGCPT